MKALTALSMILFLACNMSLQLKCSAQSPFDNSELVTKIWDNITGNPDTLDFLASTFNVNLGFGNTISSGIISTGNTITPNGTTDILTTKYTVSGAIDWQMTFDPGYDSLDYGTAVVTDDSGNVYVAGTSVTSANNFDYVILKYDSSGTLKWSTYYNGTANSIDVPTAMVYHQGYIYVTGASSSSNKMLDYCTIKINAITKHQVWVATYDYNSKIDIPAALTIDSDLLGTEIIVTGGSGTSLTNWDFATVFYNTSGTQLNAIRNSSSGLGFDLPTAIATDPHHNIYVTGRASVTPNLYDVKIVKLDSALNTVWSVTKDGGAHLNDCANSIKVDFDGNVYVTGYATRQIGGTDYFTLKYNSSGNFAWEQHRSSADTTQFAKARMLDFDGHGHILVTGSVYNIANKDILTLCYDTAGNKLWEEWHGTAKGDDISVFVKADTNNVFYVTGKEWIDTSYQYVIIKYNEIDFITPPDTEYCPSTFGYYENKGQILGTNDTVQPQIKYYTNDLYPSIYFQDDRQSFVFSRIDTAVATIDTLQRVDLSLYNSLPTKVMHEWKRIPGYLNFFKPWCGDSATEVHGYQRLLYPEVYEKIDLIVYANTSGIKYYFIIKPGGNPKDIVIQFEGQDNLNVSYSGKLEITTLLDTFSFEAPTAFQIDSTGSPVALNWMPSYGATGSDKIVLGYSSYDESVPLVIGLMWGPGHGIFYGTGDCFGGDNKIWTTYFGGNQLDYSYDIATDNNESVYVVGRTFSSVSSFPVTLGVFQANINDFDDAFIATFNDNFSQVNDGWCTYYGGNGSDAAHGVIAYPSPYGKKIFVTGTTSSTDISIDVDINANAYTQATGDGFLLALDENGGSIYFTYFGASYRICEGEGNEFYFCGSSGGEPKDPNNGTAYFQDFVNGSGSGYNDASISAFNNDAEQIWTTNFGGEEGDIFVDIAFDPVYSQIYVVGNTSSDDYAFSCSPASNQLSVCDNGGNAFSQTATSNSNLNYEDGLMASFNSDNDNFSLIWSTAIGGVTDVSDDYLTGVTTTENGDVAIIGLTYEPESTVTNSCDATWSAYNGFPIYYDYPYCPNYTMEATFVPDFYFLKLSRSGCLQVATYFAGWNSWESNIEAGPDITAGNGYIYITGCSGDPLSSYPTLQIGNTYYQPQVNDQFDAVVTCFDECAKVIWSTYLGGDNDLGFPIGDGGAAIWLNQNKDLLFVAGFSTANDVNIEETPSAYLNSYIHAPHPNYGNSADALIAAFCVPSVYTSTSTIPARKQTFDVFPNPASSEITVQWDQTENFTKLILFDFVGKIVLQIPITDRMDYREVNTEHLADGIYEIVGIGPNGSKTSKFVHIKY